jgi:hypothetical protein
MSPQRIDYYDSPEAPKANSLVPAVNVVVVNDAGEILLIRKWQLGRPRRRGRPRRVRCPCRGPRDPRGVRDRVRDHRDRGNLLRPQGRS